MTEDLLLKKTFAAGCVFMCEIFKRDTEIQKKDDEVDPCLEAVYTVGSIIDDFNLTA